MAGKVSSILVAIFFAFAAVAQGQVVGVNVPNDLRVIPVLTGTGSSGGGGACLLCLESDGTGWPLTVSSSITGAGVVATFGGNVIMPSFTLGATAVTATGTEINLLAGVTSLASFPITSATKIANGDTVLSIGTAGTQLQLSRVETGSSRYFLLNATGAAAGDAFRIHNFSHPTGSSAIPTGNNIFIGNGAGNFTLGSTATNIAFGSTNIGIGSAALDDLTTGYSNVAIGPSAGGSLTTGASNVLLGSTSGITTGAGNIFIGTNTGLSHTTTIGYTAVGVLSGNGWLGVGSSYSTAVGYAALGGGLQTGVRNTGIGGYALYGVGTSNDNVGVGYFAGRYLADGSTANATPEDSTYIGALTKSAAASQTNETVIGYDAIGKGSNTVVLGDDNVTQVWMGEAGQASVMVGAGTVGAPSIAFAADADGTGTGFYRTAADTVGVTTGGALRWSFNNAGLLAASGQSLTLPNSTVTGGSSAGLMYGFKRGVFNRTGATYSLSLAEVSAIVGNAGSTGDVTWTMPTAAAGLSYTVIQSDTDATDNIIFKPAAGDVLIWTDKTSISPTGSATSTATWDRFDVDCLDATTCVVSNVVGTWTITP